MVIQHSPEEVRRVADAVLSGAAYERAAPDVALPSSFEAYVGRLIAKAWAWFGDLSGALNDLRFTHPVLFWCIMAALVVVLALLLWHIVYTLRLFLHGSPKATSQATKEKAKFVRFDELWQEAHRLSARGEHTEAIRHLLLALLARAHDERWILPAGWTNHEIAAHLSHRAPLGDLLRGFVGTFDRFWYGRRRATTADFDRCRELVSSCVQRLPKDKDKRREPTS